MLRVRVALQGWTGGPGLSTAYFLPTTEDAASALDAVTCVRAAFSACNQLFPDNFSAQVSGDVDQLDEATGQVTSTFSVTAPAIVTGAGGTGGIQSPAVAMNVRFSTNAFIGGRRLRGRSFLSPLVKSVDDTDGTPTAAAIGWAAAYGNTLQANAGVAGGNVIWHRPTGGAGGQAASVAAVSVPDKFAILRSRRD